MDQFFVNDMNNDRSIIIEWFLNSKDLLYKFRDLSRPIHKLDTLIAYQRVEQSLVWMTWILEVSKFEVDGNSKHGF